MPKKIKVIMAKMGLDSHYRGAVMVSKYLSDRGMEVVYLGNQMPEALASAVVQEDADVLGLSSLSGNHMVMVPRILDAMRAQELDDVLVLIGGVIPPDDRKALLSAGVDAVFGTGSSLEEIADFIEERVGKVSAEGWEQAAGATMRPQRDVRQEVGSDG